MASSCKRSLSLALGIAAALVLTGPTLASASTGYPPGMEDHQTFDLRDTGFGRDTQCTAEGFGPEHHLTVHATGDTSGETGPVAYEVYLGPVAPAFPLGVGEVQVVAVDHHWWNHEDPDAPYHVSAQRPQTVGDRRDSCSYAHRDFWGSVELVYVVPPARPSTAEVARWCAAELDDGVYDPECPWSLAHDAAPK